VTFYFLALTRRATNETALAAIRRRAGSHHFRTDPNISSFDRNATPVEPDNESARPARWREYILLFQWLSGLELAKQRRMSSTNRITPKKPIPECRAVAVAAEPADETTQPGK